MIISKKFYIKPGCIRSVQVNMSTGRGNWVVSINDKQTAVSGTVNDGTFNYDSKFQDIVETYTPKRVNRKKNNSVLLPYSRTPEY